MKNFVDGLTDAMSCSTLSHYDIQGVAKLLPNCLILRETSFLIFHEYAFILRILENITSFSCINSCRKDYYFHLDFQIEEWPFN